MWEWQNSIGDVVTVNWGGATHAGAPPGDLRVAAARIIVSLAIRMEQESGLMHRLTKPADFLAPRVLHRDGVMLVIDKPAGMIVHPRPGTQGESLEDYFDGLRFGLPRKPALAHRLDRDTTGCLVLGRHPKALRKLHRIFAEGRAGKVYWAICRGLPPAASGVIDAPLKKLNDPSGWRMTIAEDGLPAITEYRLLTERCGLSFVEARPRTGRTHQIRVHLASMGCPILGDQQYGGGSEEDRRQPMMLHSRRIEIPISSSNPPVVVEAPPPAPMARMIETLQAGADTGDPTPLPEAN